jgi:hypothetical protein
MDGGFLYEWSEGKRAGIAPSKRVLERSCRGGERVRAQKVMPQSRIAVCT